MKFMKYQIGVKYLQFQSLQLLEAKVLLVLFYLLRRFPDELKTFVLIPQTTSCKFFLDIFESVSNIFKIVYIFSILLVNHLVFT